MTRGEGIGVRLPRKEDARHLHGRGRFVADFVMPGLQEVAFLRSPVAHARIVGIRVPEDVAGRCYTASDISSVKPIRAISGLPGFKSSDYPVLASGKVRFVGEPIAMCLAPTRAAAEDLCQRIVVEFDELPVLVDAQEAIKPAAPLVHEKWDDNVFITMLADHGFDAAAKQAEIVVTRTFKLARVAMVPLEGKGTLAYWDDAADELVVVSSTQFPHVIRSGLAECLQLDERLIRVIAPDIGGGFGFKSMLQPEEVCIAWLALTLRRPVRWIEDRREHLVAGAKAREHQYCVNLHATRDGRVLALDVDLTIDVGAYSVWPVSAAMEAAIARGNLPGAYAIPAYRCRIRSVATNKPPLKPYRGVARPGNSLAVDLTLDALARAIGREPADVRMANLIPAGIMPYTSVTHLHHDSGDYPRALRMAIEAIDLVAIRERQKSREPDGRLIGVGFLSYIETTALGTGVFERLGIAIIPGHEQASMRLTPDGGIEVRVGVHSQGQGHETTLAQVAHEVLGIDSARIRVLHGDTALTPYSIGTINSRSMTMAGGAVSAAAARLAERLRHIGAHLLQCNFEETGLEDGEVHGRGGQVSIREIAHTYYFKPNLLPLEIVQAGIDVVAGYKPLTDGGVMTYGTHAVVVAVDPALGVVEILDYVVVEDCGTMVNPMIVDGQIFGGAAQGIGMALYEEVEYNADGQPLASTLSDYLVPGATEIPHIRILHIETPSPYTAHGIKGAGEGSAIAPPGAILSAINDALVPLKAEVNETPATPRRILMAIERAYADGQLVILR